MSRWALTRPGGAGNLPAESQGFSKNVDASGRRSAPTHSLLVGYILWVFGLTGAHRFYFGKPITGTIWFVMAPT